MAVRVEVGYGYAMLWMVAGVVADLQSRRLTPASVARRPALADVARYQGTSVLSSFMAASAGVAALAHAIARQSSAWWWLIAGAAQLAAAVTQRRTMRRLGLDPASRTAEEAHRRRRTLWLAAGASIALDVGQLVAVLGGPRPSTWAAAVASAGLVLALLLALAAGWSGVWVRPEGVLGASPPARLVREAAPPATSGRLREQSELPAPFTTRRSRAREQRDDDSTSGPPSA